MKDAIQRLIQLMRDEFGIDIMRRTSTKGLDQHRKSSQDETYGRAAIANAIKKVYSTSDDDVANELLKDRTTLIHYRKHHEAWMFTYEYSEKYNRCMERLAEDRPADTLQLSPLLKLIKQIA